MTKNYKKIIFLIGFNGFLRGNNEKDFISEKLALDIRKTLKKTRMELDRWVPYKLGR